MSRKKRIDAPKPPADYGMGPNSTGRSLTEAERAAKWDRISLRLHKGDRARLERMAEREGVTNIADLIRRMLDRAKM